MALADLVWRGGASAALCSGGSRSRRRLVAGRLAPGVSTSRVATVAFGYWFIGLAAVTWVGFLATLAENVA